jgi:hypothetical protein
MYSSRSSFRNDDFSSSSNSDEEIFSDMEREDQMIFQFTLVAANFLELIQCKILYSLQAMMVACGTIYLSYEVLEFLFNAK